MKYRIGFGYDVHQLQENRKKPKTKSKWQERLEQMQETQKKVQETQSKNKGKQLMIIT